MPRDLGGHYANDNCCSKKKTAPAAQEDFLPLQGTDHIEFYVGNAKQAAHFYQSALGFQPLAYSRTGNRRERSRQLRDSAEQDHVCSDDADSGQSHPIADHIAQTWRRRESDRVESEGRDLGLE